jgi:predicted ATPase
MNGKNGKTPPDWRIGPYCILNLLGSGGMGQVWLAEDMRLGRKVALKLLPARFTKDAYRMRRFEQEARAASALNHPNIITIFEVGESESGQYIVMELVGGCTLAEMIGEPLLPETVAHLGAQIARALAVAHTAGIIHRDIKPENIMVRDDGLVKVLDFGIARLALPGAENPEDAIKSKMPTNTLIGTMRYMSPEQGRGESAHSPSDIFSLGLVLYELATGRHPFETDSLAEVVLAVHWRPPAPPSHVVEGIPPKMDALILRMLDRDPGRRPAAAEVERGLLESVSVRPSYETTRLQIRETIAPPEAGRVTAPRRRLTVGRERERNELSAALDTAAAGQGLIVSIAGEPGLGKTTVVEEFLGELMDSGAECRIARGRCSERLAGTEAYLPWLEALDGLIRSSETCAQAMRSQAPSWYAQIAPITAADAIAVRQMPEAMTASQERMKRELSAFLFEASRLQPLVLFFDDLHWADVSSVDLLAFLASRFDAMRVLIVTTYRPSDMLLAKHPFLQIKPELQSRGVCHELYLEFLNQVEIENYLEMSFPAHNFPPEFPKLIFAKTEGSPLFMADLIRYLRDRNVIIEQDGEWKLGRSLPEVERELPESVRGMIERKIAQLSDEERRLLTMAAVQGAQFDSVIVGRAMGIPSHEIEEQMERLERVYCLVQAIGEKELPGNVLTTRYRFVHVFYQNTLYGVLRTTKKIELSRAIAHAILESYQERHREAASELAALYEAARDYGHAAENYRQAAENAVQLFASQEAATLARKGLAALESMPEASERQELELSLQTVLGSILIGTRGYASPEVAQAYGRAVELCHQLGDTPHLMPVLYGLYVNYLARGRYRSALNLGIEFLSLAEQRHEATAVIGHRAVGAILFFMGELPGARDQFEQAVSIYQSARHRPLTWLYGGEPGMIARQYLAWTLWLEGYPDQALAQSREARNLGREVSHAQSQAQALASAALLHQYRREPRAVQELADATIKLASEQGLALWLGWGTILRGWAIGEQGRVDEAIERIRRGVDASLSTGAGMWQSYLISLLAEAYGKAGRPADGLAVLAQAPPVIEQNEEHFWEAEMYRVKGELLIGQSNLKSEISDLRSEAEAAFHHALLISRRQGARSLELRASISMARLWHSQGKRSQAHALLSEIYGWFTEGFDTPDSVEAWELLKTLHG